MEGIVPGGGVALLRVLKDLEVNVDNQDQSNWGTVCSRCDQRAGETNGSCRPQSRHHRKCCARTEGNNGFDFGQDKECDMIEAGIIDPVKVTKVALQNAASAAGTLIMTGYSILET